MCAPYNKLTTLSYFSDAVVLDSNIDSLFCCIVYLENNTHHIIYQKNGSIVCSVYNNLTWIDDYIIDHNCATITKKIDRFISDSDGNIYKFKPPDASIRCYLQLIETKINSFNFFTIINRGTTFLYIVKDNVDNQKNIDTHHNVICLSNDCHFGKK